MSKNRQLDIFIPEDLHQESPTTTQVTAEGYVLNAQVFVQGGRIVYRTTLSFSDVKKFLTHTKEKPSSHEELIDDVNDLRNRYLKPKKSNELKNYIMSQPNDFILPGLTVMVDNALPFESFIPSPDTIKEIFHENDYPDLKKNPGMIKEAVERSNTPLFGQITIPFNEVGEVLVELDTGDGNHRTKAIHDIVELTGGDSSSYYIGCDFYVEPNVDKRKEMFVDLNNGTPIERSIYNILKGKDPLSIATKAIAGIDSDLHYVQHLRNGYQGYIGFSPVDNVGARSKVTLSFNILKNVISYIALDQGNAEKNFKEEFDPRGPNFERLLRFTSRYLRSIFNNLQPFSDIKGNLEKVPALRGEYVSMSGAGLYVIARVGHIGFTKNLDPEKLAEKLSTIDWLRDDSGSVFEGGILSSSGKISNTRTALDTSTISVLRELGIYKY
ncbi:DNA sulfur modification protein DndB [Halobacillus litoralis]|uniref:DNA sulfur modification protein DndB n=1 Tax=Halobacillus litoralis TaxID=45668 RepID=UPI001CD1A798|nr:DNA sulfur modification protein DndB [Halobacillus litoralis]MCA0972474.1 DNA sulfur modification protein DndB [Halobacillus litoralis]